MPQTGCRVEGRQLGTADRLEARLDFPVVEAVRLLAVKQRADARLDAWTTVVDEWTVNELAAKRKLKNRPA